MATGQSSLYDQGRRRRRDFGLKDLFQANVPNRKDPESPRQGGSAGIAPVRNQVGRGRVSYVPQVKAAIAKPPAAAMTSRYWQLPQNWRELLAEVKWATGNGLTMEVKAPLTVTAALTEQKHPERWFVHLLNYDGEHAPTVSDIEVGLHAPPGREIARVTIVSPDGGGPVVVPVLFCCNHGRLLLSASSSRNRDKPGSNP